MEKLWNLIYYFAYRCDCSFHYFLGIISPIYYIYKLPFAKRHFEKRGIKDPNKEVNKYFFDRVNGFSTTSAYGFMFALTLCFFISFDFLYHGIFKLQLSVKISYIIYGIFSFLFNHLLLFRKDKYLKYFKKFDEYKRLVKIMWALICLGVVICIITFLVISANFFSYRINS